MAEALDTTTDRSYELFNWDNLLSLADVDRIYGKDKSTIVRNISKGILIDGVDCKKVGNSWVIDKRRLDEIYSSNL